MEFFRMVGRAWFFPLFICLVILASCSGDDTDEVVNREPVGMGIVYELSEVANNEYAVTTKKRGEVLIEEGAGRFFFTVRLVQFAPGSAHAVHVHTGTCEAPGMHWNAGADPFVIYCDHRVDGKNWGWPFAGDIGNVVIGADSTGTLTVKSNFWEVGTGTAADLIGQVVVVHELPDESECDRNHGHHPFGNPKVACGDIQRIAGSSVE